MDGLMRFIYTTLLILLSPFILLRLFWKGRKLPAYRQRLRERFTWGTVVSPPVDVWLHAVSLGEVVAATPLIEQMLQKQWRVLVTTMTPTGSEQVLRRFGERVSHQYVPYDYPWALRRFFNAIQARVGIIMETELWPNLIKEASRARLSLFLANARISDRAFSQYERVQFFLKPMFKSLKTILAQSPLDAARFCALGACDSQVKMLGNMKFDLQAATPAAEMAKGLKQAWGGSRTVVIAASTHEGEEQQLISVYRLLQQAIPDVLLLIAPRHPERFDSVYALCEQRGLQTGRRSLPQSIHEALEVIVLDSLGELLSFYAVSDYAFVGGSWVPIGGHNVLEAIALEVPVCCGPYMQNSQSIMDALLEAQAIKQVVDAEAWVEVVREWHRHPSLREKQVASATAIFVANQGAVLRHLDLIEKEMG
jgi:3-deoxy-D-manno-octulosonic-acid transferase